MKPILFNTEMVQAILDGRKTVTRRCAKFERRKEFQNVDLYASVCELDKFDSESYCIYQKISNCWNEMTLPLKPKYKKREILYVRETWNQLARVDENGYTHYDELAYVYKADKIQLDLYNDSGAYLDDTHRKWKPSIHMPKKAARLFLRVTDVRVERLSNMLGSDCVKEGIKTFTKDGVLKKYAVSENWWNEFHSKHKSFEGTSWQDMPKSIFEAFSYLWDSTVDKKELDIYGWNANPYVFVYEFEVISKEEAMKESEEL